MRVEIGQKLDIRGRYFLRGRYKNTVVFKRSGGKAVFVKAAVGTTKLLRVTMPTKLLKEFVTQGTAVQPTRFRIRVLARKFGKRYTSASRSPLVFPHSTPPPPGFVESQPDGDCDGDGTKNGVDADDDNDGLTDDVEQSLNLNPCKGDTDGDGVEDRFEFDCDHNGVLNRDETDDDKDLLTDGQEQAIGTDPCSADSDRDGVADGYEYQSARDLNDDEDQQPNDYLPYPGARPYPNPLFADADVDYDGDSLTLGEEYTLWKYVGNITLSPLSYSDGEQYSVSRRIPSGPDAGRREPTLVASTYVKRQQFLDWATTAGYRSVWLQGGDGGDPWNADPTEHHSYPLLDVNRNHNESDGEKLYNDIDGNLVLSDDERDEDADGLTNYDETHGRMFEGYWQSCYAEKAFHVGYTGTQVTNADTDGDGVRDGADDTDHDDIPNMDELSRRDASGLDDRESEADCKARTTGLPALNPKSNHPDAYGQVNPFNPCLPFQFSRTCPRFVNADTGAPFDGSPNWYSLQ